MLTREQVQALEQYSTPTILNGLKRLGMKPEQFETMDRLAVHCMAPALGVRAGFAVTRKVATRRTGPAPAALPPLTTERKLMEVPAPRILVVQNVGDWRGPGVFWGEYTANINVALECRGGITNGAVRDLPEMEAAGFQTWANGAATGGIYLDVLELGGPVSVGGLTICTGDLIHADQHGVLKVPQEMVADLPAAIGEAEAAEKRIIDLCKAGPLTLETLAAAYASR